MFRASLLVAAATVALVQPAFGGERREPRHYADPGAVVAAEIAFARLAQEKGQWTAFAATATKDARMFTPQPVNAQTWLKRRANPPVAVAWQPHKVWMSRDGSMAVTYGAWQLPRANGWFSTVWRRQAQGDYKWVLDQGGGLAQPLAAPEMTEAHVADARDRAQPDTGCASPAGATVIADTSDDGTLRACTEVLPDGHRNLSVFMVTAGKLQSVMSLTGIAP